MTSNGRLALIGAVVTTAIFLTGEATAQCPVYSLQWRLSSSEFPGYAVIYPIAADEVGAVYVGHWQIGRIEKFTSTGAYVGGWGSVGTGDGQFSNRDGVSIVTDATGFVYVLDRDNKRVQKFTSAGTYITQWPVHPDSSEGGLTHPWSIAVDRTGSCVFVADIFTNHIQKFTGTGEFLAQWGSYGNGDGQFHALSGIAIDAAGQLYAVDSGLPRVQVFSSEGAFIGQWGNAFYPHRYMGIAIDRTEGHVYVIDRDGRDDDAPRIKKFSATGSLLCEWGSFGDGDGQFAWPWGIAVGANSEVYVSDFRIQKFVAAPVPTKTTTWGELKAVYR
jgi:DNA-binding beta-propeller fold protein YncE